MIVNDNNNVSFFVLASIVFLMSMSVSMFIFVPKMYTFYFPSNEDEYGQISCSNLFRRVSSAMFSNPDGVEVLHGIPVINGNDTVGSAVFSTTRETNTAFHQSTRLGQPSYTPKPMSQPSTRSASSVAQAVQESTVESDDADLESTCQGTAKGGSSGDLQSEEVSSV